MLPCFPECSTNGAVDMKPLVTRSCCPAALCLAGLLKFHSLSIQNGKRITLPVFVGSFVTGWTVPWQISSCMLPGLLESMPREKIAPGAQAKHFYFAG